MNQNKKIIDDLIMNIIVILAVLFIYLCNATHRTFTFSFPKENKVEGVFHNAYHDLTDAFLAKQLHLTQKPNSKLLSLKDPYDPIANAEYKIHDASLYKGKYYYYFGITPLVTLYLPFKLLTKYYIPDNLVVLLYSFGGFILSVYLLNHLHVSYFPYVPSWLLRLSIGVLGLANGIPHLLRRSEMYEVAISGGFFFLIAALTCFLKGAVHKPKILLLALGSLFLGLSAGCRPQFLLDGVLLFLIMVKVFKNIDLRFFLYYIISILAPFIICIILILTYNYVRFDNPLEYGIKYTLCCFDIRKLKLFDFNLISTGVYLYLFQLPVINQKFPFIHANPHMPDFVKPNSHYYLDEFHYIVGVFPTTPFILLIFLVPLVYISKFYFCKRFISFKNYLKEGIVGFPFFEFLMILVVVCINLGVLFVTPIYCLRYRVDFLTLLILTTCIVVFHYYGAFQRNSYGRDFIGKLAILLGVVSMLFSGISNRL